MELLDAKPKVVPTVKEQLILHVGRLIRMRRRELNMSQKALAEKLQISQVLVSKYETGATRIRADDMPRLADALNVVPDYFFDPFNLREATIEALSEGEEVVNDPVEYAANEANKLLGNYAGAIINILSNSEKERTLVAEYRKLSGEGREVAVRLMRGLVLEEQDRGGLKERVLETAEK